jgi:nicotinamidase-related amidase
VDSRSWEPYLTPRDLALNDIIGKKEPFGFGTRPALLVVDAYYAALGTERKDILDAVAEWPLSCGREGWDAIDRTVALLDAARAHGVPVIYLRGFGGVEHKPLGHWAQRADGPRHVSRFFDRLSDDARRLANVIVDEVAPLPGELVIEKAAASGFHGTPLLAQLNYLGVDTVIVCGETTSGCVRASVVDGASNRFYMGVVADCCFDRTEASHYVNLFDMHEKYADVVDSTEAIAYFEAVGATSPAVRAGR